MANNYTTGAKRKNAVAYIGADGNRTALTSPYTTDGASAARQYAAAKQDMATNYYRNKPINNAYTGAMGQQVVAIPEKKDTFSTPYSKLNNAISNSKTQASGSGSGGGSAGAYNTNAPYIEQLNSLYDKVMNRKPFQYDLNGDLLYKQMADQYTQLGQQAMRDTMGQAAALTGGYGNSYADIAGNQAYQQYLTALNQQIPDLYDKAFDVYKNDLSWLMDQYNLAAAHPTTIKSLTPTAANPATTSSDAAEVMALLQTLNGKSGSNTGTGSTTAAKNNTYTYADYLKQLMSM